MKRIRDDEPDDSGPKRRFGSSNGETNGQSEVGRIKLDAGGVRSNPSEDDALDYLMEVRTVLQDQREKYNKFLQIIKDYKDASRTDPAAIANRVKELFKGHNNLIIGFNAFLPGGFKITLAVPETPQLETPEDPPQYEEAKSFAHKVKRRFQSDEQAYKLFLDILNSQEMGERKENSVFKKISVLFKHHPDLLEEFKRFMPVNSATPPSCGQNAFQQYNERKPAALPLHQVHNGNQHRLGRSVSYHSDHSVCHPEMDSSKPVIKMHKEQRRSIEKDTRDIRNHEPDDREPENRHRNFSSQHFTEKVKSSREVKGFGAINFSSDDDRSSLLKSLPRDAYSSRSPKAGGRDKDRKHENGAKDQEKCVENYMWKSIQELDLSNCQNCTPSYRLLPDDYPIPSASERTELDYQVLNDHWVSITSGSEDYSFKHMRRNQYEESLFRCEDDRFELDMLLECVISTARRAEEVLISINEKRLQVDENFYIEDYFTVFNLRCIERIYGDHGLDVLETLQRRPRRTLPVILTRLKQKVKEWKRCRSEFKKVWAEVYAKNHKKSLDHRSFYFKQQDSRTLSSKSLVAEIKDLREKMQKDEDLMMAFSTGNRHSLVKHLEYIYSENEVHDDLYKLVEYSCEECYSNREQFDKVNRLWTMFLEPFFGLPSRASSTEVTEDAREVKGIGVELGESRRVNVNAGRLTSNEPESTNAEDKDAYPEVLNKCRSSGNECVLDKEANIDHGLEAQMFSSSEVSGTINPVALTTGTIVRGTDTNRCLKISVGILDVEKEEGEITPTGNIVMGDYVICGEAEFQTEPKIGKSAESKQSQYDIEEAYCEVAENVKNANSEDAFRSETRGDAASRREQEDSDRHANIINTVSLRKSDMLLSAHPLKKHAPVVELAERKRDSQVFYGNDDFYVLFRLHQILYERVLSAKENLLGADMRLSNSESSSSGNPYASFMTVLYNFLNGSVDNTSFEEECRALLGNQSYVVFTLDKLIYKLLKQLHTVASDEMGNKLLLLYTYEKSRKPGKFSDSVYSENARSLLHEANVYRFEFSSAPFRLSIQLMDDVTANPEVFAIAMDPNSSAYLHDDFLQVKSEENKERGLILQRNKRLDAAPDEASSAPYFSMEDMKIFNGLECSINCSSYKTCRVWGTEDFLSLPKMKRKNFPRDKSLQLDRARVERLRKFQSTKLNQVSLNTT